MGMPDIDLEFVRRFTGQDRVRSIVEAQCIRERAAAHLEQTKHAYQKSKHQFSTARAAANSAQSSLQFARWQLRSRQEPVVILICWIVPASLVLGVLAVLLHASLLWSVLLAIAPFTILLSLGGVSPRDIPSLEAKIPQLDASVEAARPEFERCSGAFIEAKLLLADAERLVDGMRRASEAPLVRLLGIDPQTLDGSQFEAYLADIFYLLGYEVRRTGQSGDQGVDLIVDRGQATAVQAKCWSGSVSNGAVQQAFAGAKFYGCDRSAVITSSVFTASARELASRTDCILVEGHELPDLIRGKLLHFPALPKQNARRR